MSETFTYNYSAAEQEEIRQIREKYSPQTREADKMEQLRRLDGSVTRCGTSVSLLIGIISSLVMGFGMCCTMVWEGLMLPGIMIGLIGIAGIIVAYPVYKRITKRQRDKLAPEILRLSEELMR